MINKLIDQYNENRKNIIYISGYIEHQQSIHDSLNSNKNKDRLTQLKMFELEKNIVEAWKERAELLKNKDELLTIIEKITLVKFDKKGYIKTESGEQ